MVVVQHRLADKDIDWEEGLIRVLGKGGHERTVPLNEEVLHVLRQYRLARGGAKPHEPFFRSREGQGLSRNAIYERVRSNARKARIPKRVSPHRLRHTFATHLVQEGVGLVTLHDLLGHRQITSTQIYIYLTAQDLRKAADRHPVSKLTPTEIQFHTWIHSGCSVGGRLRKAQLKWQLVFPLHSSPLLPSR